MANPQPTQRRIQKKRPPLTLSNLLNPPKKKPHGTEKRRLGKIHFSNRITPHRKADIYKNRNKRKKKMDMSEAIEFIIRNHKQDPRTIIEAIEDPQLVSSIAKHLLKTLMKGWKYSQTNNKFIFKDGTAVSARVFNLQEDHSLKLKNDLALNYDWLYDLASTADSTIMEDSYGETIQQLDISRMADALSNASKVLKSLDDDEVKRYIIDQYQAKKKDIRILSQSLDDVGVNWRVEDVRIRGSMVDIIIKVKYSEDGTNNGVVEKTLSVEVRAGNEVREI